MLSSNAFTQGTCISQKHFNLKWYKVVPVQTDVEKMIKLLKTVQVLNFKMTRYIKNHYVMMAVAQDWIKCHIHLLFIFSFHIKTKNLIILLFRYVTLIFRHTFWTTFFFFLISTCKANNFSQFIWIALTSLNRCQFPLPRNSTEAFRPF